MNFFLKQVLQENVQFDFGLLHKFRVKIRDCRIIYIVSIEVQLVYELAIDLLQVLKIELIFYKIVACVGCYTQHLIDCFESCNTWMHNSFHFNYNVIEDQ